VRFVDRRAQGGCYVSPDVVSPGAAGGYVMSLSRHEPVTQVCCRRVGGPFSLFCTRGLLESAVGSRAEVGASEVWQQQWAHSGGTRLVEGGERNGEIGR
jgi:hypothetical protein